MKVEYVNAFIDSVQKTMSTMLKSEAKRGDVTLFTGKRNPREITALVGLTGAARGTVALSFPAATALAVVSRLHGTEKRVVDETVSDGVAELANIVAGGAKVKFSDGEKTSVHLSLPTVVKGNDYAINRSSSSAWLDVPFSSDLGPFNLRVTLELAGAGRKGSA